MFEGYHRRVQYREVSVLTVYPPTATRGMNSSVFETSSGSLGGDIYKSMMPEVTRLIGKWVTGSAVYSSTINGKNVPTAQVRVS